MSAAAAKNLALPSGPSVQEIEAGLPGSARKARTPLSLVRSAPKKRRAPFVVLCFGMLAAALIAVLVLNISVSTAQYQLVKLRAEQTALTKQNQDLTQQVQNFEAPQNLAAKAAELGMVASTATGQIDLDNLTVTGKATPATKGQNPGAVIAAPAVAGQSSVTPSAPAKNDSLDSRKPNGAADSTPAKPQAPVAPAAPKPPVVDLHGGSVPAPQQKVPGQ